MAGAGYKLFNTGDVLLASEVNTYLMQQTVMVFANASARTTALSGVLAEGMLSYLADTNATEVYDGSAWVSVSGTGDITAVTAGTGLTGGGTTGAVTLTNDMATTITASGDIVVGTGNGTYDNLPIGTTGQVLTADTTVSPYKVKWAAAASPTFVGCRAAKNASQSINDSTATAMSLEVEDYDTNSFHDNTTNNSRMTIPSGQGGYYLLVCNFAFASNGSGARRLEFRVNGSDVRTEVTAPPAPGGTHSVIMMSDVQSLNAGDYVEVMAWQNSGGALNVNYDGNNVSWFAIAKVG